MSEMTDREFIAASLHNPSLDAKRLMALAGCEGNWNRVCNSYDLLCALATLRLELFAEREKSAGLEARVAGLETVTAGAEHTTECASLVQRCNSCGDLLDNCRCGAHYRGEMAHIPDCDCFKSRDPFKVGQAVMTVIRTHQANTGREPSLSCFQRAMDELRDALASAGTKLTL